MPILVSALQASKETESNFRKKNQEAAMGQDITIAINFNKFNSFHLAY